MEKFWDFMYFAVTGIFVVFITKYICQVLVVKYGGERRKDDDKER